VTKPQGYRQSATDECFGLFVVCLPYYQALLLAGMTGLLSTVLLACLLVFVVESSPAICHKIAQTLQLLPLLWLPPEIADSKAVGVDSDDLLFNFPSLAPFLQRPPPLFF